MKRRGWTLLELVITMMVVFVVGLVFFTFLSIDSGVTSGYGKNLQLISVERGVITKYHWRDAETGVLYYSHDMGGEPLYPE